MPVTPRIRLERCANGQLCLCLGQIGWLALLKLRWPLIPQSGLALRYFWGKIVSDQIQN